MKKILKFMFHRVVLVALALILQVILLILMILKFYEYFIVFYIISAFFSLIVVLKIVSSRSNPGYKIAWIIPVLIFPVFGSIFYLLFGGNKLSKRTRRKMLFIQQKTRELLQENKMTTAQLKKENIEAYNQSYYIQKYAYCPAYENTEVQYFKIGEEYFEKLKEELKKAKHYIFLEYFIIQEGTMWNTILDILVPKVKEGLDVRLLYDDMGCIMTLPYDYKKKLEKLGIKCEVFNPFIPILTSRLNNRDHRKIAVIDGHTGFTGGINLADEYINTFQKHGHWKDSGIMLKGEAVWSLTVMFLTMWDYITNKEEEYQSYLPQVHKLENLNAEGYVQPYNDNPLDDETIGEFIYLNLINKAKKYIYITTPYLIIDNEMLTALYLAASSGVDVRIITPGVPDKKTVNEVTKAYYRSLIENGVHIYEYTPGFIHAKNFVSDDEYATVGTVNLDYRSLYLHFECGIWMYQTKIIQDIKQDFMDTLEKCHEVTIEECKNIKWYRRLKRAILKIFAPLM